MVHQRAKRETTEQVHHTPSQPSANDLARPSRCHSAGELCTRWGFPKFLFFLILHVLRKIIHQTSPQILAAIKAQKITSPILYRTLRQCRGEKKGETRRTGVPGASFKVPNSTQPPPPPNHNVVCRRAGDGFFVRAAVFVAKCFAQSLSKPNGL